MFKISTLLLTSLNIYQSVPEKITPLNHTKTERGHPVSEGVDSLEAERAPCIRGWRDNELRWIQEGGKHK